MNETQIKIIEAAEIEFAEHGFAGAAIREITKRAGVNVAAVNYHFGNKEALFKELARYRIEPINQERIKLLDDAIAIHLPRSVPLERIVDIIVRPLITKLIRESCPGFHFMRAMGKVMSEDHRFMQELHKELFHEIIAKSMSAFSDTLGNPPQEDIVYGIHFLSCSMIGAATQHTKLALLSQGKIDLNDVDRLLNHLVAFISGGLSNMMPPHA